MRTQIIQDHNGVPTGVFIPMQDWKKIINKYPDIEKNDYQEDFTLSNEQKKILDSQESLKDNEYQDNDDFIVELKKEYGL